MSTQALGIMREPSFYPPLANNAIAQNPPKKKFRSLVYDTCEHAWSYLGKIAVITRNFLNGVAKSCYLFVTTCKDLSERLQDITKHMKFLSIVGVFFSIFDLIATSQKLVKNVLFNDKEGVALSAISFTIIASDIMDSITTFVNTTLAVAGAKTIEVFSAVSLPLGFIMVGFGTISRTVHIAKSAHLYRKIRQEINSHDNLDRSSLKAFLEKTLGIDEELKSLLKIPSDQLTKVQRKKIEKLKEKKKMAILRAAPSEAVKDLEKLLTLLNENPNEELTVDKKIEIEKLLENVQKHLRKKLTTDTIAIVANMFSLAALILFAIGTSGAVPFVLVVIAFAIRLASLIYHDLHKIK